MSGSQYCLIGWIAGGPLRGLVSADIIAERASFRIEGYRSTITRQNTVITILTDQMKNYKSLMPDFDRHCSPALCWRPAADQIALCRKWLRIAACGARL